MQTGFARSWALERIAADSGLQIRQIGEHVRLTAKLVGNHWRLDGNRGDHRDANTASLHGFDQRAEISVAGEKHDVIDAVGKLHPIDSKLDAHSSRRRLFDLSVWWSKRHVARQRPPRGKSAFRIHLDYCRGLCGRLADGGWGFFGFF